MDSIPRARWMISREAMKSALERAAAGEDPDILMLELYSNAIHVQEEERDER